METLDFLRRVLPAEGVYVHTIINSNRTIQAHTDTIEELASTCLRLDAEGNNVYYAIAAFKDRSSRKQKNIRAIRTLAIDVDCGHGKPYDSQQQGGKALAKFLSVTKMPMPLIVSSGRGLHCYWPLTKELSFDEWKPLANALKRATIQTDFQVDPACTANGSLVLRPPKTHNPKNGKQVVVLNDAPAHNPNDLSEILRPYFNSSGDPFKPPKQLRGTALLDSLAVTYDSPPANPQGIVDKCVQIRWAVENQEDVPEPLWYGVLGVAAYCENPEQTAIAWSRNHPGYDERKVIAKVEHWREATTGPTTCNKFESERPQGCKGCPHYGKIGSPVRLGSQPPKVEAPPQDALNTTTAAIPLPAPYVRTKAGIGYEMDEQYHEVCPFDVYPLGYGKDEALGYEVVRFHWKRPHVGWSELVLRQAYLVDGSRDFPVAIADQGIVFGSTEQTRVFQHMLRKYMDELRNQRTMTNLYNSMGWKDAGEFVLGNRIFRRVDEQVTEEQVEFSAQSSRIAGELYTKSGSLDEAVGLTALIDTAELLVHNFCISVSASSVFYHQSGLKGSAISLCGDTGGGKTLAQYWAQAVWGNPEKLHFSAKATQNAIFNRLGFGCHLPMTIDEVTVLENRDVGNFIYGLSQGRDKARLTHRVEERDTKTWACPTILSTNVSMNSKLIAGGLETDAQLARLLELRVPRRSIFMDSSKVGRKIYQHLMEHHGHIGDMFIKKWLALPEGERKQIHEEAYERFTKRYRVRFAGQERFWEQILVEADIAGELLSKWGLIKFDWMKGIEWALAQIGLIRRAVRDNQCDAIDLLSRYINERTETTVYVMHTRGQSDPVFDHSRTPRKGVHVRFDLTRDTTVSRFNSGVVSLSKRDFKDWLSQKGYDMNTVLVGLKQHNLLPAVTNRNGEPLDYPRKHLGANTPVKTGQEYVMVVSLDHDRLSGMLNDDDVMDSEIAKSHLTAVK